MTYVLPLICATAIAVGQLLFKHSAHSLAGDPRLWRLVTFPAFLSALLLYGAATIGWVYALKTAPLSKVYPFMALAFVFVPLLSWLIFGEVPTARYAFGIVFICAGILLTVTPA